MKAKTASMVLIIAGVLTVLASLSYANSGLASPKLNVPRLEVPEINTPQIKLPLVGNAKLTNVDDSKSNNQTSGRCVGTALCTADTITKVIDGDTIYTEHYHIRLALANTPEKNQPGFTAATSFTVGMCPVGTMASIDQDDGQKTDVYGRMVAKVTCSGTNLNSALLESGHAKILRQYCAKSEFAAEPWAKKFGC